MYVLTNNNEVVVWISDSAKLVATGIEVDNNLVIAEFLNINPIEPTEIPVGTIISKYCYNTTVGFFINPAYNNSITINDVKGTLIEMSLRTHPIIDEDICTIEEFKAYQKKKIGLKCTSEIEMGIDVVLSGVVEHFSLTSYDQSNMESLAAVMTLKNPPFIPYHSDNSGCRLYSQEDFSLIYMHYNFQKLFHTTYCNILNQSILACDSKASIKEIQYGMRLYGEDLEKLKMIMKVSLVDVLGIPQAVLDFMIENKIIEIESKM